MIQSVDCVVDVEKWVVGLSPLRLDGESSSGCCSSIGSSSGGGSFLPLPGPEGEEEKGNGDDDAEGDDVDDQMRVHLGGLWVDQGAGRVSGSGEAGSGLAHSRSSTGVPVRLPCPFHSC